MCEPLFRAREPGPGQNAFSLVLDSKSRTMTSLCIFLSHYPLALELQLLICFLSFVVTVGDACLAQPLANDQESAIAASGS